MGRSLEFDNFGRWFATVALIVIMFYGGFGTNWSKPVAKEAIILNSLEL